MMKAAGEEELCTGKRQELNLMGWGFVRISREYVKGCLHSWTHPLPCLHKKLRHLASTRRTSLGFWRQGVDRLIPCKLQSWLWQAVRENQPLSFAIKIQFENCGCWGKHVICVWRVEPLWCPIWPVIEQHASSLKRNNNSYFFSS